MSAHKIFWAVFAACAVGAFMTEMPSGDAEADIPGSDTAALAVAGAAPPKKEDWYGGDIRLERRGDGHFYANPSIGGRQLDVMVDTGASFVALTGDDARAAGLSWNDADLQPVARGASGLVEGVPVMIDRIALGDTEIRNVEAAIVPEGLPVTLLGQSYLRRFDKVEIEGDTMVLTAD